MSNKGKVDQQIIFHKGYIDPTALTASELAYELEIRGVAPNASKNANHKKFYDAQMTEAQTGILPTQMIGDVDAELNLIVETVGAIEKIFEEEGEGTRMSLTAVDQIMYRLEHYRQRLRRIPVNPKHAAKLAEVGGQLDRTRNQGRAVGQRKMFQARNNQTAAARWHHNTTSTLNATAPVFNSTSSGNNAKLTDVGPEYGPKPGTNYAPHPDESETSPTTDPIANKNQQRAIPVNFNDVTIHPQQMDSHEWLGHQMENFYQSVEQDVRRQTQEMLRRDQMPSASSSHLNDLSARFAGRTNQNEPGRNEALRNRGQNSDRPDPTVALLAKLVENQAKMQEVQEATLQMLQESMSRNSIRNDSGTEAGFQSYNSSDERSYNRRRANQREPTRHRRETSSDSGSGDRRTRHNRRRPTNPAQWSFVFSGDPKSGNNKDTNPHEFLASLDSFRLSEDLSKKDMVGCLNTLLVGTARKWWLNVSKKRPSYSEFIDEFKRQWYTEEHPITVEYDLLNYRQEGESLSTFLVEFENRASYLDPPFSEKKLVQVARRNMSAENQRALALLDIQTFAQLKRCCKKIDGTPDSKPKNDKPAKSSEPRRSRWNEKRVNEVEVKPAGNEVDTESDENPYEVLVVEKFPKSAQTRAAIAEGKAEPSYSRVLLCFNCDATGHRWRQCDKPMKKFCMRCGEKEVTLPKCKNCAENYWARIRGRTESAPKHTTQ